MRSTASQSLHLYKICTRRTYHSSSPGCETVVIIVGLNSSLGNWSRYIGPKCYQPNRQRSKIGELLRECPRMLEVRSFVVSYGQQRERHRNCLAVTKHHSFQVPSSRNGVVGHYLNNNNQEHSLHSQKILLCSSENRARRPIARRNDRVDNREHHYRG